MVMKGPLAPWGPGMTERLAAAGYRPQMIERKVQLAKTGSVTERDLSQARALRDAGAADLRAAIEQVKMKTEAIAIAEADLRMAEAS